MGHLSSSRWSRTLRSPENDLFSLVVRGVRRDAGSPDVAASSHVTESGQSFITLDDFASSRRSVIIQDDMLRVNVSIEPADTNHTPSQTNNN